MKTPDVIAVVKDLPPISLTVEIAISACIIIGGIFIFIGSLGLLKLPNLMTRLHAPSKATTLGVGGCLVASMLTFWQLNGEFHIQEVLITFFLFLTAPVTAHFLAKAHLHLHRRHDNSIPPTDTDHHWSTFGTTLNQDSAQPKPQR